MRNFLKPFAVFCACLILSSAAAGLSNKEKEKAGALLFRDKGCTYCHGVAAQGTKKGPSLANIRKLLKAPQIVNQIENGGQKMPSFSDSLSQDEVALLVKFLRAKHRPLPPPVLVATPKPSSVCNPGQ